MSGLAALWQKAQEETALVIPCFGEGLKIMNRVKPVIAMLVMASAFGIAANSGTAADTLSKVTTILGWVSMPYCWGRGSVKSGRQPDFK